MILGKNKLNFHTLIDRLEVGMRRGTPFPSLPFPFPHLAPSASPRPRQRLTPVRRATRQSTYIKQMPLDTRSRDGDIKARCRRDPAGPRIADDSNSQNVNSELFPVFFSKHVFDYPRPQRATRGSRINKIQSQKQKQNENQQ